MKVDLESNTYQIERELYKAIYGDDSDSNAKVIELCKMLEDGPMHVCTIHNDTPLHKATYIEKFDLAHELLDQDFPHNKLLHKNDWGNTLLHNASTSNKGVSFLKKLVSRAPQLLPERNKWGETAVFQASRYGTLCVFNFLAEEVDRFMSRSDLGYLHFFQRDDKTTALHMAILTGYYDLALIIAKRYPELCSVRAQDRLTALQILACSPTAFRSGSEMGFFKRLIYSCVSTDVEGDIQADKAKGLIRKSISSILGTEGKPWCTWPSVDKIRTQKKSHEDVLELAKFLIPLDKSWKKTHDPRSEVIPVTHIPSSDEDATKESSSSEQQKTEVNKTPGIAGYESVNSFGDQEEDDIESGETLDKTGLSDIKDTPLILAAMRGCIEIVGEILDTFPQAMEYLNREGHNVSLVAVKNRNMKVFELLLKKNLDLRGNLRVIDRNGNCILHMVGFRNKVYADAMDKTPVLQLSEDLLSLEELKAKCPKYLIYHRNNEMKTADELLASSSEELRKQAKDWLRKTAEHCTVIVVLIATVAFAAAYTVPGGPDQQTGFPILIKKPFFLAFTMTDVLSLAFALTAVVMFLAILTSSYRLKSFRRTLPRKLLLGLTLLFLSVSMMMVSFAATVILMTSGQKEWTKIAVYVAAFFPVCIFVLSYIPLYIELLPTFWYWVKKFRSILPVSTCCPSRNEHVRSEEGAL